MSRYGIWIWIWVEFEKDERLDLSKDLDKIWITTREGSGIIKDWIDNEFKDFEFQPLGSFTYLLLSFGKTFSKIFFTQNTKEKEKEKEL